MAINLSRSAPLTGGGTVSGDLTVTGDMVVEGSGSLTVDQAITGNVSLTSGVSANPILTLENTNDDATSPQLILKKSTTSEGDDDILGTIRFKGQDDADNDDEYASIYAQSSDVTHAGSEQDGRMHFRTMAAGTLASRLVIDSGNVGIGTASPDSLLEIYSETDNRPVVNITNLSTTADDEGGNLIFRKGDGVIGGTQAHLTENDVLGDITFQGLDISDDAWTSAALIRGIINGTPDENVMPGELQFWTNSGGVSLTQKMCILANGNVGIGTAAPASNLHIAHASGSVITLSGGTPASAIGISDGSALGRIDFTGYDATGSNLQPGTGCRIVGEAAAEWGNDGDDVDDTGAELQFWTCDNDAANSIAKRMVIGHTGNVGIGTATPASMLEIHPDSDVIRGITIKDSDASCDTSNKLINLDYSGDADLDGAIFIVFQDSDGTIGGISGDGAATTYATSSDYRLKTDYKDIANATGTINNLKLYDFAWKKNTNKRAMGVIAHEAQSIVPTAIIGEKDAMTTKDYIDENGDKQTKDVIAPQQADYSKFVPLLLKAVQELSAEVEKLKA